MKVLGRLKWWLLGVVVVLLALVGRLLHHTHAFMEVEPVVADCQTVGDFVGAEDLQIDFENGIGYVSSFNFRHISGDASADGEIYRFDVDNPAETMRVATRSRPPVLRIHGLYFYSDDAGNRQLYIVNHRPDGEAIEIFDVLADGDLEHRETVTGDGLVSPNDLAVVAPGQFYFTNDDNTRNLTIRMLRHFLGGTQGNISFYDGEQFRVVYDDISMANGVTLSRDRRYVYAADMSVMKLFSFARQADNSLQLYDELPLGIPADNLNIGEDDHVWLAGQGSFLDLVRNLRNEEHLSASQVTKVTVKDGKLLGVETKYANLGEEYPSSTTAVGVGQQVFIGSLVGEGVLQCQLPD